MDIEINPKTDALIVIDIQNDFCDGGALAVSGAAQIIPGVAQLVKEFDTIVLSQDWHPEGHSSFASTHQKKVFSSMTMSYGEQTLWPDHCVQGSEGAMFHKGLHASGVVDRACAIIRKGSNPDVDSYSAFADNDRSSLGLGAMLRDRGVERIFFVGLAYDFCVGYSALDARKEGFEAVIVKDLCRAIGMPVGDKTTVDLIEQQFADNGVRVVEAEFGLTVGPSKIGM